jgi:hypothetical protein
LVAASWPSCFNAEDHETPVRLAVATDEQTGNAALAARSLIVLGRAIPADRRWSVRVLVSMRRR